MEPDLDHGAWRRRRPGEGFELWVGKRDLCRLGVSGVEDLLEAVFGVFTPPLGGPLSSGIFQLCS
jgi:hypothetical protein